MSAAVAAEEVLRLSNYNAFVLFWRLDHPVSENGAPVPLLLDVANSLAESFGQYIARASAAFNSARHRLRRRELVPFFDHVRAHVAVSLPGSEGRRRRRAIYAYLRSRRRVGHVQVVDI